MVFFDGGGLFPYFVKEERDYVICICDDIGVCADFNHVGSRHWKRGIFFNSIIFFYYPIEQ